MVCIVCGTPGKRTSSLLISYLSVSPSSVGSGTHEIITPVQNELFVAPARIASPDISGCKMPVAESPTTGGSGTSQFESDGVTQ